jgi:hypothetical protein
MVASGDAREEHLAQFAADVPQAAIHRADGAGHDVLLDGGPDLVRTVGEWLMANGTWNERGEYPDDSAADASRSGGVTHCENVCG